MECLWAETWTMEVQTGAGRMAKQMGVVGTTERCTA